MSIAFWSMVAVVLSGVIGRYIYIQIPRSIEGRELSLNEIKESKTNIGAVLGSSYQLDMASQSSILASIQLQHPASSSGVLTNLVQRFFTDRKKLVGIKRTLRENNLRGRDIREVTRLVKNEMSINKRIERLQTMQKLFRYWHVAHLPFALVMLVIVVLHVAVTLAFGYTWIF